MIALIDADSLLYYAACKVEENKTWESVRANFHSRLEEILKRTESQSFILFIGKNKEVFRYAIAKQSPYKQGRPPQKEPLYYALKAYVSMLPYTYICTSIEADDAVSILSNELTEDTVICSPDKDVIGQCPGKHFNYKTGEFIVTSEEEAKYFLDLQSIMGDSTDGIPGIPGVGIKTASKMLAEGKTPLNVYIEKFGKYLGTLSYTETFQLVYLLKSFGELELINKDEYEKIRNIEIK